MSKIVENRVLDIVNNSNNCPSLLIGIYASEFRKQYQGKLFEVYNIDDVKEVVSRYSGIKNLEGRYIVLDGVGFLSEQAQIILLKFIEEAKYPVVLLASLDKIITPILSRIKFIYKKTLYIEHLNFVSPESAMSNFEDMELNHKFGSENDKTKFFITSNPILYYHENRVSDVSSRRVAGRINKMLPKLSKR